VPTMDALAWAYFRAGRMEDALKASKQALRTGTRERSILYHAAAIHRAAGDMATARILIGQAVDGHPEFDPIEGPDARELAKILTPHPNPLPARPHPNAHEPRVGDPGGARERGAVARNPSPRIAGRG
jgi:hypothetical protein